MDEKNIDSRTKEERTFLHDIAGPIATCALIADVLMDEIKHPHLEKLKRSIEKLNGMIQARREVLTQRSE